MEGSESGFREADGTGGDCELHPEERAQYEAQLDAYRVMTSAMEKSKEEGFQKGKLEGLEEGERKGKLEIASALKRNGVDTALIAKASGLTQEEIEKLNP